MIKLYPGRPLQRPARGGAIKPGDELRSPAPTASSRFDPPPPPVALHRRRRRDGADPLLLRSLSETGSEREATYYYGARSEADLFHLQELTGLPCGFVPALSEDSNGWAGEAGLITDVVDRLEGDIAEVDAYVCGPPPMVEAAIAMLEAKGVPEPTSTSTSSPRPTT